MLKKPAGISKMNYSFNDLSEKSVYNMKRVSAKISAFERGGVDKNKYIVLATNTLFQCVRLYFCSRFFCRFFPDGTEKRPVGALTLTIFKCFKYNCGASR